MHSIPWWLVSIASGFAACCLLAIALVTPFPWGWVFAAVFATTTLIVLFNSPLHAYRRLATWVAGVWFATTASAGIHLEAIFPSVAFLELALDQVGPPFHLCAAAVVLFLLHLDYRRTKGAYETARHRVAEISNATSNEERSQLVELLGSSQRDQAVRQILQSDSHFFAVNTDELRSGDAAKIALEQITSKQRAIELKERNSLIRIFLSIAFTLILVERVGVPALNRFATPHHKAVVIQFDLPGERLDRFRIKVRLDGELREHLVSGGRVILRAPAEADRVDSIEALGNRYELVDTGPHKIAPNGIVDVKLREAEEPAPEPLPTVSFSLPSEKDLLTEKQQAADGHHVLNCSNQTPEDLHLFLLDLSARRAGAQMPWKGIPLPSGSNEVPVVNLPRESSGVFGIVVRRKATGEDFSLGKYSIYKSLVNTLVLHIEGDRIAISNDSTIKEFAE